MYMKSGGNFPLLAAAALLIAVLIFSGCAEKPVLELSAEGQRGLKIYENGAHGSVACMTCHTLDGSMLVGPSFQGIAGRAGQRIPGVSAEDYLRQSIVDPAVHVVDGYTNLMPADYGATLSEQDIESLVAFLLELD